MNEIFVTNRNDFVHEDAYDGKPYVFNPGERVTVPVVAATHMFGFGLKDRTETLIRLGWANLEEGVGVKRLAKFVFTEAELVERVIEAPAETVE